MIATSKALIGYGMALAAIYTGQAVLDVTIPASRWMTVEIVHVADSVAGVPPRISVSRNIKRPFLGEWKAEVERLNAKGGFTLACQSSGRNNYSPDNELPDDLDLNWWTYPVVCDLEPGKYRIETAWRIFPHGISPREVVNTSNVFEVKEKQK